ncbi:putative gas vesicle synthesis protein [Labilithrix luteola]|uniref:Putative gas vesicle synthesis protein n=1 Tax=Labilithrix luteola TaxID=1391654 RepID=A0A0K1PN98_9BACT|nr:putative gas vesicle synthesis protein [Labilithrix luteola]
MDVLDRVLDKGLVIAGDIKISLAEVELLTIRIRLIICSLDKAQEVGLDWWKTDPHLSSGQAPLLTENESLREEIEILQHKLAELEEKVVQRPKPMASGEATARRPPSLTGAPARAGAPVRPEVPRGTGAAKLPPK